MSKDNDEFPEDFDLPAFSDEHTAHHAAAHGHAGDPDDEFETLPGHRLATDGYEPHEAHVAFDDVEPTGTEYDPNYDEAEVHADPLDSDPAVAAPAKKSMLSKLIYPVGALGLLVVVGAGLMYTGVLGGSHRSAEPTYPPRGPAARLPEVTGPGPVLPKETASQSPSLPSFAPPSTAHLPGVGAGSAAGGALEMHPSKTVGSLPPIGFPAGSAQPAMAQGGVPVQNPAAQIQTAMNAPSAGGDVAGTLKALVASTTALTTSIDTHFHAYDDEEHKLRADVIGRLDKTDANIAAIGQHETSEDARLAADEQRIAALEGDHASHGRPAHADKAPAPRPAASRTQHAQESHASHVVQHGSLEGFALRGIAAGKSPASAYIKTPTGYDLVKLGQVVPGGGTVKEIRPVGRSWEVVTTEGIIRP